MVTVDTFLLRQANWLRVVLDGLHGFLHCGCSEGPAGTAPSLVLDSAQELCVSPIFVLGLEEATWRYEAGLIVILVANISVSWQLNALHLKELFF